jgi:hypothetical protein
VFFAIGEWISFDTHSRRWHIEAVDECQSAPAIREILKARKAYNSRIARNRKTNPDGVITVHSACLEFQQERSRRMIHDRHAGVFEYASTGI